MHKKDLKRRNIKNIDLVIIVDLYPFENKLEREKKIQNLIEYIDIGGSALIDLLQKTLMMLLLFLILKIIHN